MKTYKVQISELLQKTFDVEAESETEAYEKVLKPYSNGEQDYILGPDDFVETEITVLDDGDNDE